VTGDAPLAGRLDREVSPPPHLKQRVVRRLRAQGQLSGPAHWWRTVAAAAAAVLLFAGGSALGARSASAVEVATSPDDVPPAEFVLLLYEDAAFAAPADEQAVVDEYRDWVVTTRAQGTPVTGEKLAAVEAIVSADPPAGDAAAVLGRLSGFFVIGAPDEAAAVAVARSCPHVKYGGHIVVRRIDAT
jgi:hypothetical protein